jgi:hypothetical protein
MSRFGPFLCTTTVWLAVGLVLALAGQPDLASARPVPDRAQRTTLGSAGYLVITGARDSTAGYFWQPGPGPSRHSLVWPEGTLSLPLDAELDPFGLADGGFACGPELSGVGGSGQLLFQDGIYQVSEPIFLSDGVLELHAAGGELEVRGDQIRYRRPKVKESRTQANYIFLAGLVLLIVVLMRRARSQMGKP